MNNFFNEQRKRCLYDIYAPCNKTKCKREHRCTVFTEQQEYLRRYIKENSICVAFLLFGKCGHVKWSLYTPKFNNTHLRLRALKKKISIGRSVKDEIPATIAGVAHYGIPSQNVISEKPRETIQNAVNDVIQSVITIIEKDEEIIKRDKIIAVKDEEIIKRDKIIAVKDEEIIKLTKMVTDLQSCIDSLKSTKEQAANTKEIEFYKNELEIAYERIRSDRNRKFEQHCNLCYDTGMDKSYPVCGFCKGTAEQIPAIKQLRSKKQP